MKTLGKFEILERLGQGAMGVVYKARDPLIGRLVALKTITTGLAEDPSLLERFYREAHSAGALQHPNIVTIYELGEADKTPFIAMEYLNGSSLDKLVKSRQTLPLSQKVGYIAYLCRALAYAHKQGVVHRDVKPANVMVTTEGTVKVVDFGIASIAENSKSQSGLLIGTLGYMSPQQLEGRRADAKSDIWAAGILFYELLADRRPFDGDNYGALMLNIMTQDVPSLAATAPGTPMDVAAVVDRMLRKEPNERFQSMEEALIELEPVWRGLQRSEVSHLLAFSQNMLKAGDVTKAYETVRRVLQIDTANSQAKTLLETINAEIRQKRAVAPVVKNLQDDETIIVPATNAPGQSLPSVPPLAVPPDQGSAAQSSDTINRLRAIRTQQPPVVQPELPPAALPGATTPKWKQPISMALILLGVMIVGAATYVFTLRRQGAAPSEMQVPQVAKAAPVPSPLSSPEPSNVAPVPPAPASRNTGGPVPQSTQPAPITKSAGAISAVRESVSDAGTNKSISTPSFPQVSQPRDQGENAQPTAPPPITRTEVAVNNPIPAPSAEPPVPPAVSNPVAVVPASQPASVAAPAPISKAAEVPPAAPSVNTSPDSLDRQAITVTLQQLSVSFSHRSLAELQEIWPKLGSNRDTFKKVFDNTKSLSREFHIQSLNISSGGESATAIGSYEGKFVDGRGKETPSSGNFYVRLSKKNGRWYIDDASF